MHHVAALSLMVAPEPEPAPVLQMGDLFDAYDKLLKQPYIPNTLLMKPAHSKLFRDFDADRAVTYTVRNLNQEDRVQVFARKMGRRMGADKDSRLIGLAVGEDPCRKRYATDREVITRCRKYEPLTILMNPF
jgi:hypothetical protein